MEGQKLKSSGQPNEPGIHNWGLDYIIGVSLPCLFLCFLNYTEDRKNASCT